MRVVCAYHPCHLRRGTVDALVAQAPHAEFVDVSGDPHDYWRLFARLWCEGGDFLLVEHDIVIADGTVAALEACPEPWCTCPIAVTYRHTGSHEAYLQCNRWRREVMLALPSMPAVLLDHDRHWSRLDRFLLLRLRPAFTPHAHLDHLTFHLAPGLGTTQSTR